MTVPVTVTTSVPAAGVKESDTRLPAPVPFKLPEKAPESVTEPVPKKLSV